MFTKEGTFKARIDEVQFAEPKFAKGENDFDICIHVVAVDDSTQSDWWRGEVSQNYGKGNFADRTQAEITMGTLRKLGFVGEDLSTLAEQITGKEVPAFVKASEPSTDGHVFYNLKSITGGGDTPKAIDADEFKRRAAAMFGSKADTPAAGAAAGATSAPKPANTTTKNPFAPRG